MLENSVLYSTSEKELLRKSKLLTIKYTSLYFFIGETVRKKPTRMSSTGCLDILTYSTDVNY